MTTTMKETVKIVYRDGVSWVYLNRPKKKNAMNPTLHIEMDQTLQELGVIQTPRSS